MRETLFFAILKMIYRKTMQDRKLFSVWVRYNQAEETSRQQTI